jgi:hypothetical protein
MLALTRPLDFLDVHGTAATAVGERISGAQAFTMPFGLISPAQSYAAPLSRISLGECRNGDTLREHRRRSDDVADGVAPARLALER